MRLRRFTDRSAQVENEHIFQDVSSSPHPVDYRVVREASEVDEPRASLTAFVPVLYTDGILRPGARFCGSFHSQGG